MAALTFRTEPEDTKNTTWLYLPAAKAQVERAVARSGINDPEKIQESGRFEYDPNLDEFYDYEGYGLRHMEQESGMFTDRGYI